MVLEAFNTSKVLIFNLLKIRAGYAQVGNDTDPYQLSQTFDVPGQGYFGLTTLINILVKWYISMYNL